MLCLCDHDFCNSSPLGLFYLWWHLRNLRKLLLRVYLLPYPDVLFHNWSDFDFECLLSRIHLITESVILLDHTHGAIDWSKGLSSEIHRNMLRDGLLANIKIIKTCCGELTFSGLNRSSSHRREKGRCHGQRCAKKSFDMTSKLSGSGAEEYRR